VALAFSCGCLAHLLQGAENQLEPALNRCLAQLAPVLPAKDHPNPTIKSGSGHGEGQCLFG